MFVGCLLSVCGSCVVACCCVWFCVLLCCVQLPTGLWRVAVCALVFLRVGGRVGVCFAFAASLGVLRSVVCYCVVFVGGGGEKGV